MDLKKHTRRDFLRLTGLSAAGVIVAACAGEPEVAQPTAEAPTAAPAEPTVKPAEPTATKAAEATAGPTAEATATKEEAAAPGKYKESPMLAERVAAGELPPVDERVPEEPMVIEPYESIGQFGGTLAIGGVEQNIYAYEMNHVMGWANWQRISKDTGHAEPNVLKGYEMSPDFTQLTCMMRKGLRWSDGEPCTTADIQFWYEDILLNEEITPVPGQWFRVGGTMMTLDVVDDYTYKLTFAQPNPSFVLVNMAHCYGFWDDQTFVPAHYLKQFHIKYNDKANDLAKEAGFDFWYQLLGRENSRAQSVNRPRLNAYMPVRDTPSVGFMERNPFFWAVDTEGNQLPYIDKVTSDKAADISILDAKVVGGQYDFAAHQMNIMNYATYNEAAQAANARMVLWQSGKGSEVVYNVNCNWPDQEWGTVFQDDRFRQAMSLAINRADINNVIYFGNASETQMTVIPVSRHYKPEYAQAYAQLDLDEANRLLDEMGLEWNAGHSHRTWPTSKKDIIIGWDLVETETPKGPITELVTEYLKDVGVEIQWKSITRTLLTQKMAANEEPMSTWHGDETADTLFLRRPKFFVPLDGDESAWAPLWGRWYNTGGEQGEEPPQVIKDLYNWMDEYNLTDKLEPAANVLSSQAEHVWTIGTVGNAPHPLWCRNTLKNVSETGGFWTWDTLWTYTEFPEQWYLEQA